jgi:hypothetical protein
MRKRSSTSTVRQAAAFPGPFGQPRAVSGAGGSLVFVAMTPCRIMDTRAGRGQIGQFGPPYLSGGIERTMNPTAHPTCNVPSSARGYSLNFTAVTFGALAYLSAWPAGLSFPNVSTLNALNGGIVANAAVVPSGTAGGIVLLASNNTDLVVDINGYYTTSAEFVEVSETLTLLTQDMVVQRTAECPLGKRVIGGSCFVEGLTIQKMQLTLGGVADNEGFLWQCRWVNADESSTPGTFVFYAGAWCSP